MGNKELARAYHTAVSCYDTPAVTRMVEANYIQHNPLVPNGRDAFLALLPVLKRHGSKIVNVRMLQDGPFIVMHHVWKNAQPFGHAELAAFHIIRIDESDLIAEHWSVMAELVGPNASGRTLVDGETEIRDLFKTDENKAVVAALFEEWAHENAICRLERLSRYVHADVRQHHPSAADGFATFAALAGRDPPAVTRRTLHAVLGEGNFVVSVSEGRRGENEVACYDLFRLEAGKIAEHWSIYQDVPKVKLANGNTMFGF